MDYHSPKARKAMRAGELKRRSHWPRLARTADRLTLTHPHRGGHKACRDLAAYVAREPPEFRRNSKECRWEGPPDALARTLEAFTQAGEVHLNLDGVAEVIRHGTLPAQKRAIAALFERIEVDWQDQITKAVPQEWCRPLLETLQFLLSSGDIRRPQGTLSPHHVAELQLPFTRNLETLLGMMAV